MESGAYGAGGSGRTMRSLLVPDSIAWNSAYISVNIGGDASPVSGASIKGFVSWTTETLHLSPEKVIKYLNTH